MNFTILMGRWGYLQKISLRDQEYSIVLIKTGYHRSHWNQEKLKLNLLMSVKRVNTAEYFPTAALLKLSVVKRKFSNM